MKGLGAFYLPVLDFSGFWNEFSDEIFNTRIKRKTLNLFEIIFGFSGGHGNEQMDFTVSVTQNVNAADTQ